ncbi:MAG: hypothetical protein JWM86_2057 [Thermoleophilia bacterium]|nr:hypothetical protein [Thermoleophilia bacterium]
MTPTISPSMGALPQALPQPMSLQQVLAGGSNLGNDSLVGNYGMPNIEAPTGVAGVQGGAAPSPAPAVVGGGGAQAVAGAGAVSQEQLASALQQVVTAVNALIAALQAQGIGAPGVAGGGGSAGAVGQCGMAGCTMDHGAPTPQGANGGVEAAPPQAGAGSGRSKAAKAPKGGSGGAGAAPASGAAPRERVDPGNVKDKTGTGGLTAASKRGLEEAHKYGLPLVSGKREGGGGSDHDHGNAIDIGTLPIGVPSSNGATPTMQEFREHMRAEGKAGRLNVKYIISDGKIASANGNWEWRPYTYPGKSAESLAALKSSNPGEYNRLQHFDHVHVSFS